MKVKELIAQLSSLPEEDQELTVTIDTGSLIAANIKGIVILTSSGGMKGVPVRYVEIEHDRY
jgi:hypothetical protein